MGYWDCLSCGHKRIEGPTGACTNCGVARGPKVPFYTDDSAPVVEDPELVARARAGADWNCKYCGADNRAGMMDCHQCGAGPDGSVKRAQQFVPQPGAAPAAGAAPAKKGAPVGLILGGVGAALVLVLGLVWALFLRTTDVHVTVAAATWTKTVAVEQVQRVQKGAWADDVPSGVRVVKTETRGRDKKVQDGTEKVKTGKKDLGNGMFEDIYQERPKMVTKKVDDRWVTYEQDEWKFVRDDKSESTDGSEPSNPWATAPPAGHRFGTKRNELVLKLEGGDKPYTYALDLSKGNAPALIGKYKKGTKVVAKVNTVGSVNSIE
jgi:hypothetical protein